MKLSDYYTLESAAAELGGINYKTLHARIARGQIKTEMLGRIHLIHKDELSRVKKHLKFRKPRQTEKSDRAKFLEKHRYTYSCWRSMKQRCRNPKSKAYPTHGGRGIKVCDRWLNFENFLKDMGPRPKGLTLERKNNDGDYEPGNCKWATWSEQNKNKRPWGSASGSKVSC